VIGGAVVALMFAATAQAAPFTLIGGRAGVVSGGAAGDGNDFAGTLFPLQIGGFFGSQVMFNLAPGSSVRVDYLGAEAGFQNEFDLATGEAAHPGGMEMASAMTVPLSTFIVSISGAGFLPFEFTINNGAAHVVNGSNPGSSTTFKGPNFFATCNPFSSVPGAGGTDCNSVFLFLDDGGGGPDGDHDDFLVRLSAIGGLDTAPIPNIVENPEPASLTLLGLGLLVAVRRLRR